MPAWGTGKPEEAEETWVLVHFIRHLPHVTNAELVEMKGMNPTSRDKLRQQLEEEKFLKGDTAAAHLVGLRTSGFGGGVSVSRMKENPGGRLGKSLSNSGGTSFA